MALHIAVKGISSHQRPAWKKHRKSKEKEEERRVEAVEAVENLLQESENLEEVDETKRERLRKLRSDLEESLPQLQSDEADVDEVKSWEDLTSGNSLADVARLHCDIDMNKEIRNDFMTLSREEILENAQDYLNYCGEDVYVTHAVFSRVLPDFLRACPSPVSFAGILTMGSSFLTVNESWERYIENAEKVYKELEESVRGRLVQLAQEAKGLMADEKWKGDVWLEQLDWSPKVAKESRGIAREQVRRLVNQPSFSIHRVLRAMGRAKVMNLRCNLQSGSKRYVQTHSNPARSRPLSLSCLTLRLMAHPSPIHQSMDGTRLLTDISSHSRHPPRRAK
jgi:DNA polymerase gamma 1